MRKTIAVAFVAALGCSGAQKPATTTTDVGTQVPAASSTHELGLAVNGATRSAENRARDPYRHPQETLSFFGVGPSSQVVELWPGRGWYTEILAPLVREHGKLTVAVPQGKYLPPYKEFLASQPAVYDKVDLLELTPPNQLMLGAPKSADVVVTFRNVHGWMGDNYAPDVFKAAFEVLKPGGILGVEEHRASPGTPVEKAKDTGYVTEDTVIAFATAAGFQLDERSEINANPKDTKDHPNGVWSLPPSLQGGDQDRDKYTAIGESDRMTLRFKKPL